jgi:hypothetical protein
MKNQEDFLFDVGSFCFSQEEVEADLVFVGSMVRTGGWWWG